MLRHKFFARFVTFPENQAAHFLLTELAANLLAGRLQKNPNPILLHGPTGTGKSHLVSGLAKEVAQGSNLSIQVMSAGDFRQSASALHENRKLAGNEGEPVLGMLAAEARACDLLILEDLQHLPTAAAESLVQIIDDRLAHSRPMVFTALMGPRHLTHRGDRLPARLTSRLAAGLVVALEPLKASSRQRFLEELAQRKQLALARDVVNWLAQNLTGGGRQLEGAINQLETLTKVSRRPLDLKSVSAHFRQQVDALRPTLERISAQVGGYFHIDPKQLQTRRRYRNVLLPRQIGMFLARELTSMSLVKIGSYFGGRDHTTVLHACKKVAQAIKKDAALSGTVEQIHAELA
jgi:chromosomal replication initiator protein